MKPKPISAPSGAAGLMQTETLADCPGVNVTRSNANLMCSDPCGWFTDGEIPSGNLCNVFQASWLMVMGTFELFVKSQSVNFQPSGQAGHLSPASDSFGSKIASTKRSRTSLTSSVRDRPGSGFGGF